MVVVVDAVVCAVVGVGACAGVLWLLLWLF